MKKTYLAIRIALFALILSLGSLAALVAGETQGLALADLSGAPVQALVSASVSAAGGDTLYAALSDGAGQDGIYRSQDGGVTWLKVGGGPGGVISALAVHPDDPALLYAGTAATTSVLWGSRDGGQSWQPSPLGLPASPQGWTPGITALAMDARQPGVLYVGTDGQGVYRFDTDPLRYGFDLLGGLELHSAHVKRLVVGPDSRVYAMTNDGLFVYDPLPLPLPLAGEGVDPLPSPLPLTGGGVGGGGEGWRALSLPELAASLAVAPGDPRTLYAGGVSTGVYRSTDAGQTWERADNGLEATAGAALRITALAVAEDDARHVMAATAYGLGNGLAPGGVYESTDGGRNWSKLGDAAGLVTELSFNRGAVYAASANGLARYGEAGRSGLVRNLSGWQVGGSRLSSLTNPNGVQALILVLTLALAGLALAGRTEWVLKKR